ncbi:hypothetical protein GCM10010255_58040 [Streptomyces coeruleofuscus]|uniref:Uncharacterized protein n=1 Tax=Streptomyces coeruleofuscus TaxID=66879 RepID=A0ABP5VYQ8_9ACTN
MAVGRVTAGLQQCGGGSRRLLPLIRGHGVGPGVVPVLLSWRGGDRATGAGRLGVEREPVSSLFRRGFVGLVPDTSLLRWRGADGPASPGTGRAPTV